MNRTQIRRGLEQLRAKLARYEANPLESRSFMYLDFISWLDSKIENVPVQEVIRRKAEERGKRG
jgi:hypothetical protein